MKQDKRTIESCTENGKYTLSETPDSLQATFAEELFPA
jgi:hypothetical protein